MKQKGWGQTFSGNRFFRNRGYPINHTRYTLTLRHNNKNMSDKKGLSIPRRLPLLLVGDAVLLPGASMRIPVNNPTK